MTLASKNLTHIICPISTLILSGGLIVFYLIKRKRTLLLLFALVVQGVVFLWAITQMLEGIIEMTSREFWSLLKVQYLAICFIGSFWLLFCLTYPSNKLPSRKWLLVLIPSATFYLLMITSEYHHLFYILNEDYKRRFNFVFWMHMAYGYVEVLGGLFFITIDSLKQKRNKRYEQQTKYIIASAFIPLILNSVFIFLKTTIDLTPLSFSLTMVFFAIISYKYKFLNIVPMAMKKIFKNLNDPFLVIDSDHRIINFNPALSQTFQGKPEIIINEDAGPFFKYLDQIIIHSNHSHVFFESMKGHNQHPLRGELSISESGEKHFMVNIMPILDKKNCYTGKIISFTNITEYISLLERLNTKNEELLLKNCEIINQAEEVKELSIMKERNRIARDVHDTMGHTFTALISQLEVCRIKNKENEVNVLLKNALDTARNGLNEIRRSISGMGTEILEDRNFIEACESLFNKYRQLGIKIEFSMDDQLIIPCGVKAEALYRLCQEGVTNALRHGKANEINVILQQDKKRIKLFIIDNGKGCKNIIKGNGLKGMHRRMELLGGEIFFNSNGEEGFNIRAHLPLS